jgi:hypothetical protein
MTIQTKTTLKTYFINNASPTQTNFSDLIDSTVNFDSVSGSPNYLPKFTSASGVGASNISDNGTNINIVDGKNLSFGSGSGTKFGVTSGSTSEKLAFWNKTPISQPLLATSASATVDQVIAVLQSLGLVRQS